MNKCAALLLAVLLASAAPVSAGNPAQPAPQASPSPVRIAPQAQEAVAVVGHFFEALTNGDFATAREQLDPGVVVITNGTILGGRDAYMAQRARADAAFLKQSERQLVRRDAQGGTNFAWVLSEKRFRAGKGPGVTTSETVLLTKTGPGWKIVHIHWSTRPAS